MSFKSVVKKFIPSPILEFRRIYLGSADEFAFENKISVKEDIQEKYGFNGDLLELFSNNKDYAVRKWHHYIPIYDRYFSEFRKKKIRFLEIGVDEGGSLQMWRKYFGEDATIFGIDVNPKCEQYNGLAGQVRIGSQIDKNFLESVISEMGGLDVVLDDGSHHMEHVPVSLNYLFSRLSDGGVYMVEDLHTAYWKGWGGGYRSKKNFFVFVMRLIDDMHHWYHKRPIKHRNISNYCSGIHIHDSVVVFEKRKIFRPVHSRIS